MSRLSVAVAVLVALLASGAAAQTTLELDRIGVQQHRDYLRLQPFEQIDTQASNLIITLSDLVLPGNAGHDLRFQLTYNSESDTGNAIWRFGIPGVPMKVLQEQSWPTSGMTVQNTLDGTRGITPVLEMADGARYRTVFSQPPISNNRNTMNEVWTSRFWRYHRDTHTLELPDGTVCTYDPATLRLTQIADVYGNLVTLTWSAGTLEVQQILKNESPRTVLFAMNDATNLPSTMTFNDGTHDRVWRYTYEGDPDDSTGRLKEIAPPVGPHWRFDYENFEGYRRLAHLTTPHGGRIDYGYEIKHFVLNGQPELTRALLNARDLIDRGSVSSSGHWSIRCEWYSGETFCHQTTVETPSARLTYYYGLLDVAHGATIVEGPYGLTRVTIQDSAGINTFEDDFRNYIELPVIGTTYRSAELSRRWITRGGRTYSTTFGYDTGDTLTAQYHCVTAVTEMGELTRTVERLYVHYRDQPFIPCLRSMEKVTVGTEWVRRDFQYDNQNPNDRKGFLTWATEAGVYPRVLTMTYARDEGGNVASFTRRGMTTTYQYAGGRQTRASTPLTTVIRAINLDGTVASETSGGRTTTFRYDDLSRVTLRSPPGATNSISTEYDNADGSWLRETRGTAVTTTTVDGLGRPTLTQDSAGVKTVTEYDAEGRVVFEGYPFTGIDGPRIAIEYDPLGRVTRRTNPDGTFTTRAYTPGSVTLTDENGHQTIQTWDAFGHPDDARMMDLVDADQKRWSYGYHVMGELWAVVAPDGRTRLWLYNDQHLLSSESHPETGTTTYEYDPLGRLSQKTDANNVTTAYTYDANNRVQTITAGSRVTAFGYESGSDNRQWTSSGRLDSSGSSVGSSDHLFTFDDGGRLVSRTAFVDGKVFTTQFEYDANDALTAIAYPTIGGFANRRTVAYDLDAERRVTRVFDATSGRNYATGFAYHPSGGVTSYTSGNGVPTTITFDPARYWITSIHSGALQLEYDIHDNVGNVTSIRDLRGGMNQTFGYDSLDRLTSVNGLYSSQYAYDVHGNRQDPNNGEAYQYDPKTLRLMSQYGVPFTYDNNGNLKTAPGRSYAYTPENRIETASIDDVVHVYEYDADGWRLKKVTPAGVTYYLRGLNGELLTEWTNPGPSGVVRDYIYAGSRLLTAVATSSSLDSGDLVGTIAVGGSPVWLTIASPNQNARLFLNAQAGQTVDLSVNSVAPLNCNWTVSLIAPGGTVVTSITPCNDTTARTGPQALPLTGTYVVLVDPSGSETGSISVALTNLGAMAPSIATVSPNIGVAGAAVTITGTNLTPLSAVRLNGTAAMVGSSSSSSATFTVPTFAASGRVSVTTPSGQAVSNDDFFVPPAPYTASDVAVIGRLHVGGDTRVTIPAPNQIGLFVFDRAAGQRFTLTISNQIDRLHIQVLRPDGVITYASAAVYPFSPYFTDVMLAPVTGTYTLVVDPDETYTGTATITLTDVPRDVSGQIAAGGTPVTFSITTAGQNGRISFVATAGQRVALTDTDTTIAYTGLSIHAPDGSHVASAPVINNNVVGPVYLPLTGVYDILLNPFDTYTGTMTLTLYNVEPDVSQSIPTDGTPTTITQSIFQRAYLTFTGAVGQHLSGTIAGTSNASCGRFGNIVDPNGRSMFGVFCGDGKTISSTTLTVPGTYTIRLDPNWTATGTYTARVTLSSVEVTSLTPTSAPVGATVTVAGTGFGAVQGNSIVTFSGIAAPVLAWSNTSITVTVPAGATTGPVVVTVDGQSSNGVTFSVALRPVISLLNPSSGIVGQSITITGSNFGATQGTSTVTFNSTTATATAWSPTSIIVRVPAAATTGPVVITVAGLTSNGSTFLVLDTVTYHLHKEASDIKGLLRLRSAAPDSAATTVQSSSIGSAMGEIAIKAFLTDFGVPGVGGSIPSATPLTFTLYMRKTTSNGVIYPRVRARLNGDTGALLCQATGTTPLSFVATRYVLSCTTGATTMTSTDRIYLWVGVNVTTAAGGNTRGELSIEGTNGGTDSLLTLQIPR
jgi:YD repeat-containing protein